MGQSSIDVASLDARSLLLLSNAGEVTETKTCVTTQLLPSRAQGIVASYTTRSDCFQEDILIFSQAVMITSTSGTWSPRRRSCGPCPLLVQSRHEVYRRVEILLAE